MALSDGDYGGAFGGGAFGDLLSPAFGQLLASNPEAAIPFLVQAGVDPNDFMKMASLGTGLTTDAGGGPAPLEAGYPAEPDVPPTSSPSPTPADEIRGYRPEPQPTETTPTSELLGPDYKPPGPGEPGYVSQAPTVPSEPPSIWGPSVTDPDAVQRAAERLIRSGREGITGAVTGAASGAANALTPSGAEDPEAAAYGGAQPAAPGFWDRLFPNTDPSAVAGAPAPTTPAAAAAEAPGAVATPPPMAGGGTGFNTYGQLGGLYPLAVPPTSASGTTGGLGGPGMPLPLSDPRRTGVAGPTGASGASSSDTIKKLSAALAGVKMPPQPAQQALRPAIPSGASAGQGQNSLIAMLTQLLGGGAAGGGAASPLRLGTAVGGR